MFDSDGTTVQTSIYDSYENIIQTTEAQENSFTYTGTELDTEIDTSFYRAHYYDLTTGFFICDDPIDFPGRNNYLDNYGGDISAHYKDLSGNRFTKYLISRGIFGPEEDLFEEPLLTPWDVILVGGSICQVTGKLILKTPGKTITRGIGPVLKGEQGVAKGIAQAKINGETVLGKEITIDTTAGRTKIDILTRTKEGKLKFIECKNGHRASLTPNQKKAFPMIQSEGGIPTGRNAEKAGLIPGMPIGPTEVQIFRFLP